MSPNAQKKGLSFMFQRSRLRDLAPDRETRSRLHVHFSARLGPWLTLVACLGTLSAGRASAQAVEPDFMPLLEAAEADCAVEHLEACRTRAELVSSHLPARSALSVRARGLLALTTGTASSLPPDEALEPLVHAAETAPDRARASAYAEALRLLVPEGSPLLTRALVAASEPAPSAAVVLPAGYATSAPSEAERPEADEAVRDIGYHRRDDGEMVDFYTMSALAGGGFTAYLFAEAGWAHSIAPFDEGRVFAVAPVLGAGLFLLLPFGLDQIDHGMPAGAPSAIAMGLRFGLGLSALTLGAVGGVNVSDAGHVMFGSTLASALVFGAIGYLAHPHPSQVQMIQNTGLWGGTLGAFLALTIAPHMGAHDGNVASGLGLLGVGSGLLVGSLLSGLDLHLSSGRSWLGSLGMLAGAGAGALVYLLIGGLAGNFDPTIAGVAGLIGSGAGLGLGLWLSEDVHGETHFPDGVTVSASIAPTNGGGLASIEGTF